MRTSLLLLLLLLSLAAAAVPFQPGAAGAAGLAPQYPLSMGFSPSTLSPVGQGVPVYTTGDQLWLMSPISMAVNVATPGGTVVAGVNLSPMDPVLVYSFSSSDAAGSWSVTVLGSSETLPENTISFAFTQDDLAPASLTGYALSGSGQLQMNFSVPAVAQYDIQACAVGVVPPETASIPIPGSVGTGALLLGRNGSQLEISTGGQILAPFEFWVELHQNYSYSLGGPSTVASRDVRVAATGTITMASGETAANATFVDYAQVRDGRFTLRAFFDTPTGISVAEARVLAPDNDTWISLPGCSATARVGSTTFSLSASLAAEASTRWPTAVYTMYESEGVEMVSETSLGLMPAVLSVVATPWGTALTDSRLTFTPGPGVDEAASGGGALYLVATSYPVQVGISGLGGLSPQTVLIERPFSLTQVQVNSSKLSVSAYLDGAPVSGASITILGDGGTIAHAVSRAGSASVFYLPEGNYTVKAALGNATQVSALISQTGRASVLRFDFVTQSSQGYLYVLLATAALGAAASALVWIKVYRDRR
ncbi:MAG: carboxypeptidase-like regulatory domain-containing protein [Thaumarchaeota archaeon]|nr:carboxypeptidase-like regulatory domain-containing protein [Nitrososphaerota archaeon]